MHEKARSALAEQIAEHVKVRSTLAEQLAHEQRAALEGQAGLGSRVRELEEALERERQSGYEHALARGGTGNAYRERTPGSECGPAGGRRSYRRTEGGGSNRSRRPHTSGRLRFADIEAQLANERREREQADTQAESERQAHTLMREAIEDLRATASDQARAYDEALARCAEFDARVAALQTRVPESSAATWRSTCRRGWNWNRSFARRARPASVRKRMRLRKKAGAARWSRNSRLSVRTRERARSAYRCGGTEP